MTEDDLQEAVRAYFGTWIPDPAEGWFQAADMGRWLNIPRNTAECRLKKEVEAGRVEARKYGRENWYRLPGVNMDSHIHTNGDS